MLRQMKYFQAVVKNNSFSEAAYECNILQSAISQQIQALERELVFTLLQWTAWNKYYEDSIVSGK